MSYISLNLNLLINAVKKAGDTLTRDFNEIEKLQTSVRGHQEFTNAAIDRVSKILRIELQKAHPDYVFASGKDKLSQGHCYVINPLDGKNNFMHAIPYFATSIAEINNGKVVAAVIYNPATADLYFAEKGNGTFKEGYRNHERLRVSARKDMNMSLLGTSDYSLAKFVADIRTCGSLSLDMAYLASGKLDAVVSKDNNLEDFAAGLLLVKEAGGYVYEYNQKDIRTDDETSVLNGDGIIAANTEIGPKLFESIHR